MSPAAAYRLVKEAAREFVRDKAPRLGAALAFYTALSLAPLLLVLIGLAGLVFGAEAARGEIFHQVRDLVGDQGAAAIETMLANSRSPSGGVVAVLVGFATLTFGATGVFAELQAALDTVWNVDEAAVAKKTGGGLWGAVRDRLLSFSVVCGLAFLLLVSLAVSALLAGLGGWINAWVPFGSVWLPVVNAAFSLALTTLLLAMIFKVLPHARVAWADVWVGAVLTALLFNAGKFLIGLYLGRAAVGSTFGAAGSFVVLLVWIYYSTQIVLFGAEFTQAYAARRGASALSPPLLRGRDRVGGAAATTSTPNSSL